jgi:predicted nucleotidyltransferase component of viral defense system
MIKYKSAVDFRMALEERLKQVGAKDSVPVDRLRRKVAFDRFLVRIFSKGMSGKAQWLLKGGYALEYRLGWISRATTDIDFTVRSVAAKTADDMRGVLQEFMQTDSGDWFDFRISEAAQDIHQALYGGWRFPVNCMLAGRTFSKFSVDVNIGDAVVLEPESETDKNSLLGFAGIQPTTAILLPRGQQFAEKIHAYTLPRENPSRVKDLVDLILLIEEQKLPAKGELIRALKATFDQRHSHSIPKSIPVPPNTWKDTYAALAEDCGVSAKTIGIAHINLDTFWKKLFE